MFGVGCIYTQHMHVIYGLDHVFYDHLFFFFCCISLSQQTKPTSLIIGWGSGASVRKGPSWLHICITDPNPSSSHVRSILISSRHGPGSIRGLWPSHPAPSSASVPRNHRSCRTSSHQAPQGHCCSRRWLVHPEKRRTCPQFPVGTRTQNFCQSSPQTPPP